jgi:hypothetical protein
MRTEIEHMREALASYIEATYHLSNPKVVNLRRKILMGGGIAQTPYIESTAAYMGSRKFETLDLDQQVRDFLTSLASKEGGHLLFDPPYEHQAQALELTTSVNAGGTGIVVTTGTGSGKTESFLLPVLARLAEEAIYRPDHFSGCACQRSAWSLTHAFWLEFCKKVVCCCWTASGKVWSLYRTHTISGNAQWRPRPEAASNT